MKACILLFLLLCPGAQGVSFDTESRQITLTQEEMKTCGDAGGCLFITHDTLVELAEKIKDLTDKSMKNGCI